MNSNARSETPTKLPLRAIPPGVDQEQPGDDDTQVPGDTRTPAEEANDVPNDDGIEERKDDPWPRNDDDGDHEEDRDRPGFGSPEDLGKNADDRDTADEADSITREPSDGADYKPDEDRHDEAEPGEEDKPEDEMSDLREDGPKEEEEDPKKPKEDEEKPKKEDPKQKNPRRRGEMTPRKKLGEEKPSEKPARKPTGPRNTKPNPTPKGRVTQPARRPLARGGRVDRSGRLVQRNGRIVEVKGDTEEKNGTARKPNLPRNDSYNSADAELEELARMGFEDDYANGEREEKAEEEEEENDPEKEEEEALDDRYASHSASAVSRSKPPAPTKARAAPRTQKKTRNRPVAPPAGSRTRQSRPTGDVARYVDVEDNPNVAGSQTSEDQEGGDSLTDTEDEISQTSERMRRPPPNQSRPANRAPPPPRPAPLDDWQDMEEQQKSVERQRGKLVTFFKNGDPFFRGLVLNINKRMYPNFETLLVDLTDKIPMVPAGVFRYVFRLPDRKLIKSVTEFERGRSYVVSKDKRFKDVKYGTNNDGWRQAPKIKRNDLELFKADMGIEDIQSGGKTRVLTITSNTNRSSVTKLLVNPSSAKQTFEDLLMDLASMVDVRNPPVTCLFTREAPQRKIASFSQLMREGRDTNDFLVCGTEQLPLEQLKRIPPNAIMSGGPRFGPPYPAPQPPRKVQSVQSLPSKLGYDGASPPLQRRGKKANSQGSLTPLDTNRNASNPGTNGLLYVPQYHRNWRDVVRTEICGRQREFYAPSQHDVYDDGRAPDKRLRLDWVYGFRGRDVRQNLVVYPDTGEAIYFVAAVVVLYDKNYDAQRHYLGHTEEITCICLHPNEQWIASGQRNGETGAHVRIWDAGSLNTHHVIGLGVFQVGIASISFSIESGGELMVAVDESKKHEMTVWDMAREKLLAKTTTTTDQVNVCSFYPQDDSILITVGKQHLYFWKIFWNNGRDMEGKVLRDKKSGVFELKTAVKKDEVPKHITAMCFTSVGEVITGDTSGAILVWARDEKDVFTLARDMGQPMKRAFRRPVTSMYFLQSGLLLAASGNTLRAYDSLSNFRQVKERVIPEGAGTIRTVYPQAEGEHEGLYLGTMGGCIVQGSLQNTFNYLVQGHSDAVWAVASHPHEPSFITAGHDQYVIKWNAAGHSIIWRVMVEAPCTCIAINPRSRGGLVAMGTTTGMIILLNSYNGMHLSTVQISAAQLNCMAFSPDGELLAVGTHDGIVHTLEVYEDFRLYQKDSEHVKGNHSPISQMDWSSDGRFLQTVQGDFDLSFWETERLTQVKNPRSMRDTDWYTLNTTVGYNLTGPWENLNKGDVMNVVCRSNFRDLIITGDSKGHLRLYKYPCSAPKPKFQGITMYSENITAAAYLEYDSYVLTAGGGDANLIQWAVINPANQR